MPTIDLYELEIPDDSELARLINGDNLNDMNTTQQRMAAIFNEWARRYAEKPDEFSSIIGADGKPIADYGENCARYFEWIAREMDSAGVLPKPVNAPSV